MKYTKQRLQKLAGLLKEDAASDEKFKYNRVYYVMKQKVSQFLKEEEAKFLRLIERDMEQEDIRLVEGEDGPLEGNPPVDYWLDSYNVLNEVSGIRELLYNLLGKDSYLVQVLEGEDYDMGYEENHEAGSEALFAALDNWLMEKEEDIKDMYREQLNEISDAEEYNRDPYHASGVKRSDFY